MATVDLVFEGGGAKGMAFVGALDVLLAEHTPARLLGTSAGAIAAVLLAAGYTVPEIRAALVEETADGTPVLATFLGEPKPFDQAAIEQSAIRKFLQALDLPFVPEFVESLLDERITQALAEDPRYRHLFAFVERGGWYSADAFVAWITRKLNEGEDDGVPRTYGSLTLAQFYDQTGVELSLVASDTTAARMLILNHNTAPNCPVVWATRMSMGIPLLWGEIVWQEEWNPYTINDRSRSLTNHLIVDGGMLSNFPIALFLAPQQHVAEVMGAAQAEAVLGLLIDEATPVPQPSARGFVDPFKDIDPNQLRTVQRLMRLINTMTLAHDNAAIEVFRDHVVRLPAGGYGTTEFDMTATRRQALVDAGAGAMQTYLDTHAHIFAPSRGLAPAPAPTPTSTTELAARMAADLLSR